MVLHLVIFSLLLTALVFSIIELGLSAYITSIIDTDYFRDAVISTFSYNVFASVWTLLVTAFLLAWPFVGRAKFAAGDTATERWLAPLTLALNTVTMIFWLAAFASVADLFRYGSFSHYTGSIEAFGVLLWLIFLALTILSFLTAFGVYKVDRPGHSRIFRGAKVDAVRTTNETTTNETTEVA
ncbi:hypothetical protein DV735_g5845, partial [Chaetothyriales sp. CBS 134920]